MHNRSFLIGIVFGIALTTLSFFAFVNGRFYKPINAEAATETVDDDKIKIPIVAGLANWTMDQMGEISGKEFAEASEKLGFDLELAVGRVKSELPYDNLLFSRQIYFDSFGGCERLIAIEVCGPKPGYLVLGTMYGRAHAMVFSWADPEILEGVIALDPAMGEGPLPEDWDMDSELGKDFNFVEPEKRGAKPEGAEEGK